VIATRDQALARDAADPLAPLRGEFTLPEGVIYLDGNSLGALPRRTAARLAQTIARGMGRGPDPQLEQRALDRPRRANGDRIAGLIGAGPAEVSTGDSTSVNLFKALHAAAALQKADAAGRRCCSRSAATSRPTSTSPRASRSPPG
jgi:kynureninase